VWIWLLSAAEIPSLKWGNIILMAQMLALGDTPPSRFYVSRYCFAKDKQNGCTATLIIVNKVLTDVRFSRLGLWRVQSFGLWGRVIRREKPASLLLLLLASYEAYLSTLNMETIYCSETLDSFRTIRRFNPEYTTTRCIGRVSILIGENSHIFSRRKIKK
jgi:hypothetical protein